MYSKSEFIGGPTPVLYVILKSAKSIGTCLSKFHLLMYLVCYKTKSEKIYLLFMLTVRKSGVTLIITQIQNRLNNA